MVIAFMLRGNAFAVMTRNMRNQVTALVPINPDRVVLWQSPDGSLFWAVTRSGLHEVAVLKDFQWLIPYEDVFHLKDVSSDGLVGTSPIMLAREAIGLSLGQEQQYARLMGNGARPSGILTTDQKLDKTSAERLKADWKGVA
jgi:HK97 family phage portal protein